MAWLAESLPERLDRASRAEVTHDTTVATKATSLVLKTTKVGAGLLALSVCTFWTLVSSAVATKVHVLATIAITCALVVALALWLGLVLAMLRLLTESASVHPISKLLGTVASETASLLT